MLLPVNHGRPGEPARFRNSEDSCFVRFPGRSGAETFVFHCEVLTPQVRRCMPKPGLPEIAGGTSRPPSHSRPRGRKVVITSLAVTGKYCGEVTLGSPRTPARQVTASPGPRSAGWPPGGRALAERQGSRRSAHQGAAPPERNEAWQAPLVISRPQAPGRGARIFRPRASPGLSGPIRNYRGQSGPIGAGRPNRVLAR